jgi:hypothetical protein
VGPAVEINRFDGARPIAHIGGIPQRYHTKGRSIAGVFPLNIAVSASARGRGLMSEISQACFAASIEQFGNGVFVGVPNASSTPGYTGRLGFRFVRPLPVRIVAPFWPSLRGVESVPVTQNYLDSRAFEALVSSFDFSPGDGFSHQWTAELLTWRLSAPHAQYALHTSADLAVVTTSVRHAGVPMCVVVKTFRRLGGQSALANALVAKACRFHRAPAAIYAGFSSAVRVLGVPLPARLKPAPLNLIVRSMKPSFLNEKEFEFDRFEFFDFDPF